ncbi:hypothetical protein V6N12_020667 [Hibiscus sabdariffa]|uniref:Uncharacterized protein n=1 Tax=Hibiscus sabdariffa TaxID=183260 RepID=A0ABR2CYT4_9ROSI
MTRDMALGSILYDDPPVFMAVLLVADVASGGLPESRQVHGRRSYAGAPGSSPREDPRGSRVVLGACSAWHAKQRRPKLKPPHLTNQGSPSSKPKASPCEGHDRRQERNPDGNYSLCRMNTEIHESKKNSG